MKINFFIFISILIFSACAIKDYKTTQSKIVIIKSPKIKFSDLAYIRNTKKAIELELFIAGTCIEKITINHLICTSEGCMGKSSFNEEYLSRFYPDDILQNILLSLPIYKAKNIQKINTSFTQNIKNKDVDISYRVDDKITFFKDRKNHIIFKIKNIK